MPVKSEKKNSTVRVVLPRPVNGPYYDGWSLSDWMLKVCEECGEAVTAKKEYEEEAKRYQRVLEVLPSGHWTEEEAAMANIYKFSMQEAKVKLCRELTDVITAATSVLESLGADFEKRQKLQDDVNHSNAERDGGRRFREE